MCFHDFPDFRASAGNSGIQPPTSVRAELSGEEHPGDQLAALLVGPVAARRHPLAGGVVREAKVRQEPTPVPALTAWSPPEVHMQI